MIFGDDSLPLYTTRTSPARRALPSGTSGCCRDGCPVLNICRSCWFGFGQPASTRCRYRSRAWFVTAIELSDGVASETVGEILFLRCDCWLDIVLGRPDVTAIARSRSRTNFAGTRPTEPDSYSFAIIIQSIQSTLPSSKNVWGRIQQLNLL